jgi:AAHS family 4-hydroxybenzoate transporter-like MFS transporter
VIQTQVAIASIVDRIPLAYRIRIVGVCFLIVLTDGFDTQAIGFAAPAMSSSLAIPIGAFGQIFSASLFGAMLGALSLGAAADRLGRRWTLVGAVATFSLFSLLTPVAPNFPWLLLCRFLAGLGLGGAIPNVLALSSEYAPRRIGGLLTGLLWAGFPLGGVIGAITSAHLLPVFGWPVLFYIGGSVPLILAALVIGALPESLQFLLRRSDGQRAVATAIRAIGLPAPSVGTVYVATEEPPSGFPIQLLFFDGRVASTILLWIGSFMNFALLIVLVLWTPALLQKIGLGGEQAALVVGLNNLGAVAGTMLGGRLVDRFAPYVVLPLLFMAGALAVGSMGYAAASIPLLALFSALSGFFLGAATSGLLGVAVLIYPSMMRATGIGWVVALGRLGQVAGPLAVGALVASALSVEQVYLCCVMPALCAMGATAFLMRPNDPQASGFPEDRAIDRQQHAIDTRAI